MKHIRVKEVLARDPSILVLQNDTGPAAGGLWNTSIMIGDVLVLSSLERYCLGGVTAQYRDVATGLYGTKEFLDLPGGAIAWWPGGGFLTYESQWATVLYHPVDERLHPLPGAAYPVLSHAGIPNFPAREGHNIAVGDITGDGKPDVLITLKDWAGDGYYPDGERWNSLAYRPYVQREGDDAGHDPRRDERLPFWGSKALTPYQRAAKDDPVDGHVHLDCKDLFGGLAKDDILCSVLPRNGPCDFSLARTYRGKSPTCLFAVFAGNGQGVLPNIDMDDGCESAFEYAGTCKLENGEPVTTFADAGACILPGGHLLTVDFVGEIQYFKRVGPGLTFKERPVKVEGGKIPAIHGCIGTASMELDTAGRLTGRIVLSGEYGLTQVVKFKLNDDSLWIECPDDHPVLALGDHFKEDILVVPSFVDEHVAVLGSGAGRYTKIQLDTRKRVPLASRLSPYTRLRIQAGPVGSVQGTTEERWGYTCPCVFDMSGDGNRVVISGDISEYLWLITPDGRREVLRGHDGKPMRVAWRTRPAVFSIPAGNFLVTLDPQNNCTVFHLHGTNLRYAGVIACPDGTTFGAGKHGGARGRLKFEAIRGESEVPDLLVGTPAGTSFGSYTTQLAVVARLRSRGTINDWSVNRFEILGEKMGDDFSIITFGHHCCAPATVPESWDGRSPKHGKRIVVGAEDGRLYYFKDPRFFAL
ncbi:MAG: hypothetical protein Q6373_023110 [Candidatus Sigynarchaeota archaeon]